MGDSVVTVGGHEVRGVDVDPATRCAHYATERDVVAFRFPCCETFYPCAECHAAVADHGAARVPRLAFDAPHVLCGGCGTAMTVTAYLEADHECPACDAAFNPGCANHYDRYFEGFD